MGDREDLIIMRLENEIDRLQARFKELESENDGFAIDNNNLHIRINDLEEGIEKVNSLLKAAYALISKKGT